MALTKSQFEHCIRVMEIQIPVTLNKITNSYSRLAFKYQTNNYPPSRRVECEEKFTDMILSYSDLILHYEEKKSFNESTFLNSSRTNITSLKPPPPKNNFSENIPILNQGNLKYTRILKIHVTGSDGNPNGLHHEIEDESKKIKSRYQNFQVVSFMNSFTRPRMVEGTDTSTGQFVRVTENSPYLTQREVRITDLPNVGLVYATVPIDHIRDKKYEKGFRNLLEWVSDPNHIGKIRITGHGSSQGTIGMSTHEGIVIHIKHFRVANWLIEGGVNICKTDGYHTRSAVKAGRGLTNIHVFFCLSGTFKARDMTNTPDSGFFQSDHLYFNKESGNNTYNLRPNYVDDSQFPEWMKYDGPIYGSGIAQYVRVFQKHQIFGVEITGSMDSVCAISGKHYRLIGDGTPEQIFIYNIFKPEYDDYKRKAAPSINSGWGFVNLNLKLKERKFNIEQRIQNGRIQFRASKFIRDSSSSPYRTEANLYNYEVNFIKSKLISNLTSYSIIIPPTNYTLTVAGNEGGCSSVRLCELLTHSPNKIREIS